MSTSGIPLHESALDLFIAKIEFLPNGCWKWTGNICNTTGYGRITIDNIAWSAHIISYRLFKGVIPEGLQLDHICTVPFRACVNPDHLEAVTQRVNLLRGNTIAAINAAKTNCPKGHEYNEVNTYIHKGMRHCRVCHKETERLRRCINV